MAKQIIANQREPYSQITIRLPESILAKLEFLAEKAVQTKSQYLIKLLQEVIPPNSVTEAVNQFWASSMPQMVESLTKIDESPLLPVEPPTPIPDEPPNLTELQIRICSWFHRKPSTKWTDKEIRAYRKNAHQTPSEDVDTLDRYYTAKIPEDTDYRRRDIATLLNNWPSELDRARTFAAAVSKKRGSLGLGWISSRHPPENDETRNLTPEEVKAGIEELKTKLGTVVELDPGQSKLGPEDDDPEI